MTRIQNEDTPQDEAGAGNIIFLVLVAIMLLAALIYAATRVSWDGRASNAGRDGVTAGGAPLAAFPAAVRLAALRMVVGGVPVVSLAFNDPSDMAGLAGREETAVFHPAGGKADYQRPPAALMAQASGRWHFNMAFEIDGIGTAAAASPDGNDLVAFLPGVRAEACRMVNRELGIDGIPAASADLSGAYGGDMLAGAPLPAGEAILGARGANGTDGLTGKAFGCFRDAGGRNVYYHLIIER